MESFVSQNAAHPSPFCLKSRQLGRLKMIVKLHFLHSQEGQSYPGIPYGIPLQSTPQALSHKRSMVQLKFQKRALPRCVFFFFIFLFTFSGFDFPLFSFSGWIKILFKRLSSIPGSHLCRYKDFFFTLNVCICPSCVHCFLIDMLLFILLLGCMWEYVCTQKWSVLCVYVFMYRDTCISMLCIDLFLFYIISLFLIPMLYVNVYTYIHIKHRKKK